MGVSWERVLLGDVIAGKVRMRWGLCTGVTRRDRKQGRHEVSFK